MDENAIQAAAANVLLDRGVTYKLAGGDITIRPLRFGTVVLIAQMVAESGLTSEKIEAGDRFTLRAEFGKLMLRCVAVAELNERDRLTPELIDERMTFYGDHLTTFQVYELFIHVLNLSGIQAFKNTIILLLQIKERNLSPKRVQGS
jgi:hypothetical protein